MSELHKIPGSDNTERKADVIFIHGLGGDAFTTWRHSEDESTSWPHWLGKEFPAVGVWSLGYAASSTKWARVRRLFSRRYRDSGHSMALPNRALQVLDLMVQRGLGPKPIMFVCHSLGGLLAKQILRTAADSLDGRQKAVFDKTRAILFLSTPHAGADLASLMDAFRTIFGATVSIEDLRAHDAHLANLYNWYRNHSTSIQTVSYFETRNVFGARIVNQTSAHPGVGADPVGLDENHISIAKPNKPDAQVCDAARDLLRSYVLAPPPTDSTTGQTRSGTREPSVVSPLAPSVIPAPPEPYLAHPYPMQANFTGRVTERKELTNWFNDTIDPMFVYEAIGGMGKSAVTWCWLHVDVLKAELATEGVIWWSFYEKESRFETFLEKALTYLTQDEQKVRALPSPRERMEWLRQLLCKKRYLIILDGAERVLRGYAGLGSPYQGDEVPEDKKDEYRACIDPNAGTFLQWLTSVNIKSKTLITSRLFPKELDSFDGCRHNFLDRMDKDDAIAFFQQQKIKGTRAEIETACERYGYHPLSLRLLTGMIIADPQYNRDIRTWAKFNPLSKLKPKEHDILELAYNSLNVDGQKLISELAAFRNPMAYDSMAVFQRDFSSQQQFDAALIDLVDRGLLLRDQTANRHDLHPIIRSYCYDRLRDKQGVHSQLRDYFAAEPEPDKVTCMQDLTPVIELYYHTVRAGQFDEAYSLFQGRIDRPTYYQFCAYQLQIELLQALFPDGEDHPPRLKDGSDRASTLNDLALVYSLNGQPRRALQLFEGFISISEKRGDKSNLTIGLANVASLAQIRIGALRAAETNLGRSIALSREIKSEHDESIGHAELGRLLAYRGNWAKSNKELSDGLIGFEKNKSVQDQTYTWSYQALRELFRLRSASQSAVSNPQSIRLAAHWNWRMRRSERNFLLSATTSKPTGCWARRTALLARLTRRSATCTRRWNAAVAST